MLETTSHLTGEKIKTLLPRVKLMIKQRGEGRRGEERRGEERRGEGIAEEERKKL